MQNAVLVAGAVIWCVRAAVVLMFTILRMINVTISVNVPGQVARLMVLQRLPAAMNIGPIRDSECVTK